MIEKHKIERYLDNLTPEAKDFLLLQLLIYPDETQQYIKRQIQEFDVFFKIGLKTERS